MTRPARSLPRTASPATTTTGAPAAPATMTCPTRTRRRTSRWNSTTVFSPSMPAFVSRISAPPVLPSAAARSFLPRPKPGISTAIRIRCEFRPCSPTAPVKVSTTQWITRPGPSADCGRPPIISACLRASRKALVSTPIDRPSAARSMRTAPSTRPAGWPRSTK